MVNRSLTFAEFVKTSDRQSIAARRDIAEKERVAVVERFPLTKWPEMTLEQYALGQDDGENTFCQWLEFRTLNVASMRGGSAMKHLIFKRRGREGWYFDPEYRNEQEAWKAVRAGFVEAFNLAQAGKWDSIDGIAAIERGQALRTKSLYIYFPQQLLPISTKGFIKHFLQSVKPEAFKSSYGVVQLNRVLLEAVREVPELRDWDNWEIVAALYGWADPRESRRIVKIAPGKEACYWSECLAGEYICIGWDKVGDLSAFANKEEFLARFTAEYSDLYKPAKREEKANEVWTLRELEPGDLVVANEGTSKILAIGEVVDPGYQFRPDRKEYQHTVAVKWDTRRATSITPQKRWAFVTVAKVPLTLYEEIRRGEIGPTLVDPFFEEIGKTLERKGQVILYGPPGTGKTYSARRFAVWWLLHKSGVSDAAKILADEKQMQAKEAALSTTQVQQRVWWMVTNPKEWKWQQLKKDGKVTFDYARLNRNFPRVQKGDLVVGYQSSPDKQLMAIAKVSRGLTTPSKGKATIELEYGHDLKAGLTYDELMADKILAVSEPMSFRNQGTLFALTSEQANHVLGLLGERDPVVEEYIGNEGGICQLTRLTFHASYSYEDFVEGFRPVDTGASGLTLRLEDGVFKRICREAQAHADRPYLVMIDEINRANVAKVLGELITLLEVDKRGMIITLPQSKESFTIPPNVYVLGTMNTADRSIKLLDAALRRRIAFVELMPDVELLSGGEVQGLDLAVFLSGLNARIAEHAGREKQIGHSFLMEDGQPIAEADEFSRRFRQEILPLLQEYCYDDYGALARYLGDKIVDAKAHKLRDEILGDPARLIEVLQEEFDSEPGATS